MSRGNIEVRRATQRRYRESHREQERAKQRRWPWAKAFAAAKQTKRRARAFDIPQGSITKEIMARLHLLPCAYCGVMPAMEADHIRPFRFGGQNTLDNLAPCCTSCNRRRGAYVFNAIQGKASPAADLWPEVA